jgi:hypothetical protein
MPDKGVSEGVAGVHQRPITLFGLDFLSHLWYLDGRPVQLLKQCLRHGGTQIRHLAGKEENGSHNGFEPAHPASPVGLFAFPPVGNGL